MTSLIILVTTVVGRLVDREINKHLEEKRRK